MRLDSNVIAELAQRADCDTPAASFRLLRDARQHDRERARVTGLAPNRHRRVYRGLQKWFLERANTTSFGTYRAHSVNWFLFYNSAATSGDSIRTYRPDPYKFVSKKSAMAV